MTTKSTVAVVGAAGYAGGELCRLLLGHPQVGKITPFSRNPHPFGWVHPNLRSSGLAFTPFAELEARADHFDAVFLSAPSGEAMMLAHFLLRTGSRVIDLSADFRFADPDKYTQTYGRVHSAPDLLPDVVYGATEINRGQLIGAKLVANPGCYVITALLALAPLLEAGLLDLDAFVHVSAVNGTTGAGSSVRAELLHAEVFGSMLSYNLDGHRHAPELEDQLGRIAGRPVQVDFTAAHGNFTRGIHLTVSARLRDGAPIDRAALLEVFVDRYGAGPNRELFVEIVTGERRGKKNDKDYAIYPRLVDVIGTNGCHIGVDCDPNRRLVRVVAVVDNLIKGAAGSAIQNFNVAVGYDESAGLNYYGL